MEIAPDCLCGELIAAYQRKLGPQAFQSLATLLKLGPKYVSAEAPIDLIEVGGILTCKEWPCLQWLNHINQNEVLTSEKIDVLNEVAAEDRIIQRSEEDQQRAPTQTQTQESEQILEIGRNCFWFQGVKRVRQRISAELMKRSRIGIAPDQRALSREESTIT